MDSNSYSTTLYSEKLYIIFMDNIWIVIRIVLLYIVKNYILYLWITYG